MSAAIVRGVWEHLMRPTIKKLQLSRKMSIRGGGGGEDVNSEKVVKPYWSFCLRTLNSNRVMDWYILKLNNIFGDEEQVGGHITPIGSGFFAVRSLAAALGSSLYCFDRGMYVLDTNRIQDGFQKAHPMTRQKDFLSCLTFKDKIYCFGDYHNSFDPIDEYFDPKSAAWERISPPREPYATSDWPGFFIPVGQEHIGLITDSILKQKKGLLYNVVSDSWTHWDCPISLDSAHGSRLKVAGTLYWIDGALHAYDLSTGVNFSGPIRGSVIPRHLSNNLSKRQGMPRPHPDKKVPFFHLGGNDFCFFQIEWNKTHSIFHCTQFQVVKEKGRVLDAKAFSIQSYFADGLLSLVDGFPLSDTCIVQTSHKEGH